MTDADFLRAEHAASGEATSFTAWLEELAEWVGVTNSAAWKWVNGTRKMTQTVRKLIFLRTRISPELRRAVAEL